MKRWAFNRFLFFLNWFANDPTKRPKSVVDVGCGIGGSSRYIASKFGAKCQGITLSPIQAQRANALVIAQGLSQRPFTSFFSVSKLILVKCNCLRCSSACFSAFLSPTSELSLALIASFSYSDNLACSSLRLPIVFSISDQESASALASLRASLTHSSAT